MKNILFWHVEDDKITCLNQLNKKNLLTITIDRFSAKKKKKNVDSSSKTNKRYAYIH